MDQPNAYMIKHVPIYETTRHAIARIIDEHRHEESFCLYVTTDSHLTTVKRICRLFSIRAVERKAKMGGWLVFPVFDEASFPPGKKLTESRKFSRRLQKPQAGQGSSS